MKKALRNRTAIFIILALCCLNYSAFTQDPKVDGKSQEDEELKLRLKMGEEIIEKARKAIYKGIKPKDVKTVYFETEGKLFEDTRLKIHSIPLNEKYYEYLTTHNQYLIEKPNRIKVVRKRIHEQSEYRDSGDGRETLETFDGDNYFYSNFIVVGGTKRETTNKNKRTFEEITWQEIFSFFLFDIIQEQKKFKYIGQAETPENRRANVIEAIKFTPERGKTVKLRLFFEEKSNLLLMSTLETDQKYKIEKEDDHNGSEKIKRTLYFSDRVEMEGLLIPQKIKITQTENWRFTDRIVDIKSVNQFLSIRNRRQLKATETLAGTNLKKTVQELTVRVLQIDTR